MRAFIRERRLLIIVFIVLFPLLFRPRVYGFDPVGYFSWLRSAVIDGNLDTTDEYLRYGNERIAGATVTGYNHNPYAIGAPLLWSPFYLAAHAVESARSAITQSPSPDGYGDAYVWAIGLGSALLGFTAVLILHGLTRRLYGEPTATIGALVAWLASPLVFYMYSHPAMAHAADAFANALTFAAWFAVSRDARPRNWLLMGASIGLAALVRTQNVLIGLVPGVWLLAQAPAAFRSGEGRAWLQSAAASGLGALIGFALQMIVWRVVYGSWIELNPYAYTQGAGHFTGTFQILPVLFSTDRGLFVWSPVLLFALAGLAPLYAQHRRLAAFLIVHFAAQALLVSAWSVYNGALAFGARLLLQNTPTYVVGLTAFVDWLRRRGWSARRIAAIGASFVAWNFLLIVQYSVGTVPRTGAFPIGDLIAGQFTVLPTQFGRILTALLTRQ
ncbi:MAG TPA: glycosyltransferase family 39 protein [Anaerolineae bacterium]|nr:glycosyltransferase family 39 protein [Anaerolineae bacterium]